MDGLDREFRQFPEHNKMLRWLKDPFFESKERVIKDLRQKISEPDPPKPLPKKRGPKPSADGRYKIEVAAQMRKEGRSHGQIARIMYGDARKRNCVAALLAQARKSQSSRKDAPLSADDFRSISWPLVSWLKRELPCMWQPAFLGVCTTSIPAQISVQIAQPD